MEFVKTTAVDNAVPTGQYQCQPMVAKGKETAKSHSDRLQVFGNRVLEVVQREGIIDIQTAFLLYQSLLKSFKWSASSIAKVSDILIKEFGLIRLDVTVPGGKPIELYKGHHKVLMTSFFVDPARPTEDGLALANTTLNNMVEQAIQRARAKKEAKRVPKTKVIHAPKQTVDNTHAKFRMIATGYVSCRRNRQIIIHLLVIHHFGRRPFTIDNFLSILSLDLYMKVVGIDVLPPIFYQFPWLRQLLICQFPTKYLDIFDFKNARSRLEEEFRRITYDITVTQKYYVLFEALNPLTYRLIPQFRITWPNHDVTAYNFSHITQATAFWKRLCLLDLVELSSPCLAALWKKRYVRISQNKSARAEERLSKPHVLMLLQNRPIPLNFDEFERFAAATGQEQQGVKNCLTSMKRDNSNPQVRAYCKGNLSSFSANPALFISTANVDESLASIKDPDIPLLLNHLVALSSLTTDGIIVSLPRPVKMIAAIINQHLGKDAICLTEIGNRHAQFMSIFPDYVELYEDTIARTSASINDFNTGIEVSRSTYIQRFSVVFARFTLPSALGELVERLKAISLFPTAVFELKVAVRYLQEIAVDRIDDAVFFLKLIGFLSQKVVSDDSVETLPFMFVKHSLRDFRYNKPSSFYSQYLTVQEMMTRSIPAVTSTVSTCAFFLEEPAGIELEIAPVTTHVKKNVSVFNRVDVNAAKGINRLTAKRVVMALPKLPPVAETPPFIDTWPDKMSFDVSGYPVDVLDTVQRNHMEIYVIIFQMGELYKSIMTPARFILGYIEQYFSRGVAIDRLCYENRLPVQEITQILEFLIEFQYVAQVHSERALPQFAGGDFTLMHLVQREYNGHYLFVRPHIWVQPGGETDSTILTKLLRRVVECIEMRPGSELFDILAYLPSVCVADVLHLLALLEFDEVVASVCKRVKPASLATEEVVTVVPHISDLLVQYEIEMWLRNPEKGRTFLYYYPTSQSSKNLAWIGGVN